jgi:hypothetical protein
MTANNSIIILMAASILAAVIFAGCASPTPAPAVTPTATVPPTISPAPTPPVSDDRANVTFTYVLHGAGQNYDGLLPAGPGELYYTLDVTVNSDKPIRTDGSWFTVQYRRNGSAPLLTYTPTVIDYPSKTIGDGSGPAEGRLLVTLPEPEFDPYGPVPVYFKPIDQQEGPNKVYAPVYGFMRS